jgi:hypothetical protein
MLLDTKLNAGEKGRSEYEQHAAGPHYAECRAIRVGK